MSNATKTNNQSLCAYVTLRLPHSPSLQTVTAGLVMRGESDEWLSDTWWRRQGVRGRRGGWEREARSKAKRKGKMEEEQQREGWKAIIPPSGKQSWRGWFPLQSLPFLCVRVCAWAYRPVQTLSACTRRVLAEVVVNRRALKRPWSHTDSIVYLPVFSTSLITPSCNTLSSLRVRGVLGYWKQIKFRQMDGETIPTLPRALAEVYIDVLTGRGLVFLGCRWSSQVSDN